MNSKGGVTCCTPESQFTCKGKHDSIRHSKKLHCLSGLY
jgi:hypothetical protein